MRVFREPLLQFLALGGGLFAAWPLLAPEAEAPRERIVVDAARIASLEQRFAAIWNRPPSEPERAALIDEHLAEEVLYREAQKLGLDRDDVVIRRRMRQKVEFLLQDGLALVPPDEAALRAFFREERARYRTADRIALRNLLVSEEIEPASARALLLRLNAGETPDAGELGPLTMLPSALGPTRADEIDRIFGTGFAARLLEQARDRWAGPVPSGYGSHLALVEVVQPGADPDFETVRDAVLRDYANHRREREAATLVARLKVRYDIIVDRPGAELCACGLSSVRRCS